MTFFLNPARIGVDRTARVQPKSVRPERVEGLRKDVSANLRIAPFEDLRVTGSVYQFKVE
jgi:hypothetical protein